MRWSVPGRGRRAGAIAAACAALATAPACIGTTHRDDFDRIVQERGGGLTSEVPLDAVVAVADELGTDDFDVRTLAITPLDATVVLEVRDPAAPANLDRYTVNRGSVEAVEPIRLAVSDDLDAQTFPISDLALDEIESMVDSALADFDQGGYVTSMTARRLSERVVIQANLESPRSAATATFTGDGDLAQVTRT